LLVANVQPTKLVERQLVSGAQAQYLSVKQDVEPLQLNRKLIAGLNRS
jgi:hypothetical protein